MGFASARTFDIEVWAPGQGTYLEVSSVSNCEDFQSRRMNLRFKSDAGGENTFPHILNGSGTALARLFVALIETYQQADGSVTVPKPLQPYLKIRPHIHGAEIRTKELRISDFGILSDFGFRSSDFAPHEPPPGQQRGPSVLQTSGLADCNRPALAKSFARAGHRVGMITPLYASIRERFSPD